MNIAYTNVTIRLTPRARRALAILRSRLRKEKPNETAWLRFAGDRAMVEAIGETLHDDQVQSALSEALCKQVLEETGTRA